MSAIYGIAGESSRERQIDIRPRRDGCRAAAARPGRRGAMGRRRLNRWRSASAFCARPSAKTSPGVLVNEDRSLMMVCDGHVFNARTLRSYLRDRGPHGRARAFVRAAPPSVRRGRHFRMAARRRPVRAGDLGRAARSVSCWAATSSACGRSTTGAAPTASCSRPRSRRCSGTAHVPRAVDETALADFLTFTSVPGPRTLFRGIRKVPAGSAAICASDGSGPRRTVLGSAPESDSGIERRALLRRARAGAAPRRRSPAATSTARSDRCLSGGNDSSANAALLSRDRSRPLHTFTVGLADSKATAKYNDIGVRAAGRGIDRIGASRTPADAPTNSSGRFR